MKYFFLSILFSFYSVVSGAADLQIPNLDSPVMDGAKLFNSNERANLAQLALELYRNGGPQLTVLTVENLQGYAIEEFSIRVAEKWKLGTKEKDNGLLLVIAKEERSVRLEVGNGIEGEVTDIEASQYTQHILPEYFKQGEFYQGVRKLILDMANKFSVEIQADAGPSFVRKHNNRDEGFSKIFIFLIAIVFALSSAFFPRRPMLRATFAGVFLTLISLPFALAVIWYMGIFLIGMLGGFINLGTILLMALTSRGGGGGYGGSSGGSWGGGGGGFSGGGSSGRW